MSGKRYFILHWADGKDEPISGYGVDQKSALTDAYVRAGHKEDALIGVDYWEEVKEPGSFVADTLRILREEKKNGEVAQTK